MKEKEYNEKLNETLNTPEKIELFKTDSAFRQCIECIARGQDPIDMLVSVCNMRSDLSKQFELLLMRMPAPAKYIK